MPKFIEHYPEYHSLWIGRLRFKRDGYKLSVRWV